MHKPGLSVGKKYLKDAPETIIIRKKTANLLKPAVEAAIILIFALGLYVNTLNHGFVLDDMMMITHNAFTKEGFNGVGKILTNDAFTGFHGEDKNLLPGGRYRPLSQIMFAVEYGLFGENPLPGHLINILLYAMACMLLYKAMRLLFEKVNVSLGRLSLPFIITLLYAIHPLHTEGVANIKGRDEILSLIGFALLAILALRYSASRRQSLLILMVPVFFLSMLSKESALTFLAAIPLLVLFREQRFSRSMFSIIVALFTGLVLYIALRLYAIGIPAGGVSHSELLNDPFLYASASERFATLLFTWIKYVALVIFPAPLTHDYYPWHITYKSFANGAVILSILFFCGLAWYSLKRIRRPDMIALGFLLFVILFSSQSNLLINIGAFMNERFIFLALLGIIIMFVWVLVVWLPGRLRRMDTLSMVILVLIVAGFSLQTVLRNRAWKDDFTLFTTDVKVSVNSAKVNVSAGGMYLERALKAVQEHVRQSYLDKALFHLKRGVELHPRYYQGHILFGNGLMLNNNFLESFAAYESCLKMNPRPDDALSNAKALGRRAFLNKDNNAAVKIFGGLLEYRPEDADIAASYAEALMDNQDIGKAQRIMDSLYVLNPDNSRINHLLGQLWGRYKAFEPGTRRDQFSASLSKARYHLQQAVDAEPRNYGMIENLAIVHGMSGNFSIALDLFNRALDLMLEREQPESAYDAEVRFHSENLYRIYKNIGDTYGNMGDMHNLLLNYEKAYGYNPNDPVLVTTLAGLYTRSGDKSKGVELLTTYLNAHPGDRRVSDMLEQISR